ncbi:MAG: FMN-binding glutamate synthase family protein [Bdellovibrionales bacterium]
MRWPFFGISFIVFSFVFGVGYFWTPILWTLLVFVPLFLIGVVDLIQTKKTVRRNFPVIGNLRYLFEMIRPELQQYFVESDTNGVPINREYRSVVYQRAKGQLQTRAFGTKNDLYAPDAEWVSHSMCPTTISLDDVRVTIGGSQCRRPYNASVFNISAMSYGSLSAPAIEALNRGAAKGNFYHNTGEGGISPYHLNGGDLCWQLGTAYFGCRTPDGKFCAKTFAEKAAWPQVKMIEVKVSQGAKPGKGGMLPGEKVTAEVAAIRGVHIGKSVLSPPGHSEFSTPKGLLEFIAKLRELSGGKPVGFKICIGRKSEFLAVCKAMVETKIYPDFITVDGAEGGTGAAPLEFLNSVGMPLNDGLSFVHDCLRGYALRDEIKIIASGKVITAFHMIKKMSLGADVINPAQRNDVGFRCIHAPVCNTNRCPVGITTNDKELTRGLHIPTKADRVANFHQDTVHARANDRSHGVT